MGRSPQNLLSYYDSYLAHGDKKQSGYFSLDESNEVMRQVFTACPNVLTDGEDGGRESEVFTELGKKLNRGPNHVYTHWKIVIEPVLTRHKVGTLDVDYKDRIVRYMVSNGLQY